MSEERKVTQEDLNKARENSKERTHANVVTGDIVIAKPLESDKKSE